MLVLIPLIVTFVILRFAFVYIDDIVRPWVRGTQMSFLDFPGVGVLTTFAILYVVGVLVPWDAGRRVINWPAIILTRIPVVKTIYGVAKQATDALSAPLDRQFNRVVFVEWPRPGVRALGFVTGHTSAPDREDGIEVAVYIPTVPNPTSGMLAFVSKSDLIETDITVEDAMKTVFSGGIVLPQAAAPVEFSDVPLEPEHSEPR